MALESLLPGKRSVFTRDNGADRSLKPAARPDSRVTSDDKPPREGAEATSGKPNLRATAVTNTPLPGTIGEAGATITHEPPQWSEGHVVQEAIPTSLTPLEYAFAQRVVGEGKLWPTYAEIPKKIRDVIKALNQAYEQITSSSFPPTPAESAQIYQSILAQLSRVDEIVGSREDVPNRIAALLDALRDGSAETRQIVDRVAAFVMLETLLQNGVIRQHVERGALDIPNVSYIFNDRNEQGSKSVLIAEVAKGLRQYRKGHKGNAWGDGSGELMDKFAQAIPNWPAYADVLSRFK